eukprot:365099-Chlamydomonas_euryale.AAC.3
MQPQHEVHARAPNQPQQQPACTCTCPTPVPGQVATTACMHMRVSHAWPPAGRDHSLHAHASVPHLSPSRSRQQPACTCECPTPVPQQVATTACMHMRVSHAWPPAGRDNSLHAHASVPHLSPSRSRPQPACTCECPTPGPQQVATTACMHVHVSHTWPLTGRCLGSSALARLEGARGETGLDDERNEQIVWSPQPGQSMTRGGKGQRVHMDSSARMSCTCAH